MTAERAPTGRRLGAEDSATRAQLVDAAEALLLDEGYASVTSRRVAARAGLKPQLVHYYFRTMDDLFVEVFRRRADEGLERYARFVDSDTSLAAVWRSHTDPRGAVFTIQFAALATHRPSVRAEVADYAERFRAAQLAATTAALAAHGVDTERLPPVVVELAMTGLAQVLAIEAALGVTTGHDTVQAWVDAVVALPQAGTKPRGSGSGRSA